MSKMQNTLVGLCLLSVMVAVSYLGVQYLALKSALEAVSSNTSTSQNNPITNEDLTDLKNTIAEQNATIAELNNQWQSALANLNTKLETNYLTKEAPLDVGQAIYSYNESTLTTEGNVTKLLEWQSKNRFYLNEILEKSLTLSFDPQGKGVVVDHVEAGSIYAQIGLKAKDRLVSLNGQPLTRNTNIKQKLLEPQSGKLVIVRENQNVNLAIQYNSPSSTPSPIKVAETQYQNQKAVKVIELDDSQSQNLKPNDVILSINGQNIPSTNTFYEAVSATESKTPLSFSIVRDGTPQNVNVALSAPESNTP